MPNNSPEPNDVAAPVASQVMDGKMGQEACTSQRLRAEGTGN